MGLATVVLGGWGLILPGSAVGHIGGRSPAPALAAVIGAANQRYADPALAESTTPIGWNGCISTIDLPLAQGLAPEPSVMSLDMAPMVSQVEVTAGARPYVAWKIQRFRAALEGAAAADFDELGCAGLVAEPHNQCRLEKRAFQLVVA